MNNSNPQSGNNISLDLFEDLTDESDEETWPAEGEADAGGSTRIKYVDCHGEVITHR